MVRAGAAAGTFDGTDHHMPRPFAPPCRTALRRTATGLLLVLLGVGCASGPKYGAARRKKKSCDCPHWNMRNGPHGHATGDVRVGIDPAPNDPHQ